MYIWKTFFITVSLSNIYEGITILNVYVERIHKTLAFSLRILYFFFFFQRPLFDPRDSSSSSFFFSCAQRAFDDFHSFPSERFRSTFVSRRLALFKQDSDKGNSIPRPFATSLTGITIILL